MWWKEGEGVEEGEGGGGRRRGWKEGEGGERRRRGWKERNSVEERNQKREVVAKKEVKLE